MDNNNLDLSRKNIDKFISSKYRNKTHCLAPKELTANCCGNIVKSHLISKRYLKEISENNHVYYPIASHYNQSNLYEFKEVGLNRASCFDGFCQAHDNSLFDIFERQVFTGNTEQVIRLSYRIIAKTYFYKLCSRDYIKGLLPAIHSNNPDAENHCKNILDHTAKELKDIKRQYGKFANAVLNKDCYPNLQYRIFQFEKNL